MGRLTVRLPDTLHRELEARARQEGISLNQYIVYLLTRQVTLAYTIQALPEEDVERQRVQFAALLRQLGQASHDEVQEALAEREVVTPEAELPPDVISRLQARTKG